MAVVNTKSTLVSNADATPKVMNNPVQDGGGLREKLGVVAVAAADDDTSTYRMVRVPSNARISSIDLIADAIAGAVAYECGVYQTADNGGAVVVDDVFSGASGIDIHLGGNIDMMTGVVAANRGQPLWQLLGLSSDPLRHYDIVLTADTVGTAAGNLALRVRYTDG